MPSVTRELVVSRMDAVLERMEAAVKRTADKRRRAAAMNEPPLKIGFALCPDYAGAIEPLKRPGNDVGWLEYEHKGYPVMVSWFAEDGQEIYFGDLAAVE